MAIWNITPAELAVVHIALTARIEYFSALLDDNENFGYGIEEIYKSELEDARKTLGSLEKI